MWRFLFDNIDISCIVVFGMSTTLPFLDVAKQAEDYIFRQICMRKKTNDPVGETAALIFERIIRGDFELTNQVLLLVELEQIRGDMNGPQEDQLYELLAQGISRCQKSEDTDLIEFVLLKQKVSCRVRAMCWIMRGNWGYEDNLEGLWEQWGRLQSLNLSRFFEEPEKTSDKRRRGVKKKKSYTPKEDNQSGSDAAA